MIGLVITVICLIALIAVVLWYVRSVNIGPPLIYAIYAGVAILAILCIVWIMDRYGGGTLRLGGDFRFAPVSHVAINQVG